MILHAKQRLHSSSGIEPDEDYTNVPNRIYRALRQIDKSLKVPFTKMVRGNLEITFKPERKLGQAQVLKAIAALDSDQSSIEKNVVFFFMETRLGVQYQEVVSVLAHDQEEESKLIQVTVHARKK